MIAYILLFLFELFDKKKLYNLWQYITFYNAKLNRGHIFRFVQN